jgi:putative transposase
MDTREVAKEYRLTQWAKIIQTRAQSGQSIKDFCKSAGISRNSYFYWQRKLREGVCAGLVEKGSESRNSIIPSGWAQLSSEADCSESSVTIEISGCRITTTMGTDLGLLVNVCRALRSL